MHCKDLAFETDRLIVHGLHLPRRQLPFAYECSMESLGWGRDYQVLMAGGQHLEQMLNDAGSDRINDTNTDHISDTNTDADTGG